MSEKLLLLVKEKTVIFVKQTKANFQETIEYEMTRPMQKFHLDILLISEEDKRLLGLTILEAYNSVFNIAEENHNF